jgi:predicted phage terminase large subunit-like protein
LYPVDKLKFYQPEAFEPGYNIGYVDPAFGKSEKERKPCYFALVILSQIEDQVYVVDWITNRESPEQNEALIVEKAKEWGLRRLGVESNAAQSVWCKDIEKALHNAQVILDVEPINHNENKDRRIESMHGTVVKFCNFRADWDQAYPEAMSQLINFPQHKYKDAPDALEGGLAMIMGDAEVRIR